MAECVDTDGFMSMFVGTSEILFVRLDVDVVVSVLAALDAIIDDGTEIGVAKIILVVAVVTTDALDVTGIVAIDTGELISSSGIGEDGGDVFMSNTGVADPSFVAVFD